MKTIKTIAGQVYAITSPNGCTVTDDVGTQLAEVEINTQQVVVASGSELVLSDDSARASLVFKYAPAKLWALGVFGRGDALPAGYLPALFIESTGTQYIDTEIRPFTGAEKCTVGMEIDGLVTGPSSNTNCMIAGCGQSGAVWFSPYRWWTEDAAYAAIYLQQHAYPVSSPYNNRIRCSLNFLESGVVKYSANGGDVLTKAITHAVKSYDYNIWLFGGNQASVNPRAAARIWSAKISDGATLVRAYVPAISPSGVACMYDKIQETSIGNSGSGAFIVGMTAAQARKLGNLPDGGGTLTISLPPDVVDENGVLQDMAIFTALSAAAAKGWNFILQTHDGTAVETAVPAGYMQCEFLESSGTQYLDTGITLSNESEVTCEFSGQDISKNSKLYGAEKNGNVPLFRLYAPVSGTLVWYNGGTKSSAFGTYKMEANVRYSVVHNNDFRLLNGEKSTNHAPETNWETLYTSALFGCSGYALTTQIHNGARVYSFTISRAGTEQANYTPSIDAQGVPCMWDSVTAQPFTNDGSGQFIVGMTAAQAVQLANLPEGGGELTVSLPQSILNEDGEITDAAVRAALNKAADNGWTITLQYYTN